MLIWHLSENWYHSKRWDVFHSVTRAMVACAVQSSVIKIFKTLLQPPYQQYCLISKLSSRSSLQTSYMKHEKAVNVSGTIDSWLQCLLFQQEVILVSHVSAFFKTTLIFWSIQRWISDATKGNTLSNASKVLASDIPRKPVSVNISVHLFELASSTCLNELLAALQFFRQR